MSQITNGIRSILSYPTIYNIVQNMMGSHKVRQELVEDFIRPKKESYILDIGCGTAEILHYLPNEIEYWGYDISIDYISSAKAKYGLRGNFNCGLFDEVAIMDLPKFDIILALGVLHHLDDNDVYSFFRLAKKALNIGGRIVTIDPCLTQNQNPIAKFIISKDRGQNVRECEKYQLLANDSFSEVVGVLKHRKFIPYTHWIMECYK